MSKQQLTFNDVKVCQSFTANFHGYPEHLRKVNEMEAVRADGKTFVFYPPDEVVSIGRTAVKMGLSRLPRHIDTVIILNSPNTGYWEEVSREDAMLIQTSVDYELEVHIPKKASRS